MICPHCGKDVPYVSTSIAEGERFRQAVYNRLVEYGYDEKMNPPKYQAYLAIRKSLQVRFGLEFRPAGSMTAKYADRAIECLDIILPSKTGKEIV